jgi:hypothetical protein
LLFITRSMHILPLLPPLESNEVGLIRLNALLEDEV